MAKITTQAQSFLIDGRPMHILGAALDYPRIHPDEWASRLVDVREAGFNTVMTAVPWMVHEPRPGRYTFAGHADLGAFLTACRDAGLQAVVGIGPFVGSGYDGGGLPAWITSDPDLQLRGNDERWMSHVSTWISRLLDEIVPHLASANGPVVLVQAEQNWCSSNDVEGAAYLNEIVRLASERGIDVPIFNTNNLWQEVNGTFDTWTGSRDLLRNLRQFRTVQPDSPSLVSAFDPTNGAESPDALMRSLAQVFAAGAHVIVDPFAELTNVGTLGCDTIESLQERGNVVHPGAPVDQAGNRNASWTAMKRLITFANHFAPLITGLDPDLQPVAVDPAAIEDARHAMVSVVTQRGTGGRLVFVFADRPGRTTSLLLDNGLSLPVELGDQSVGWYVVGADLGGRGRLDYANVMPSLLVNRSVAVFSGPKKARAWLSISGAPIEATIPSGKKPTVLRHNALTLVFVNQDQLDATFDDGERVYVGIDGFDHEGEPRPRAGYANAVVIESDGESRTLPMRKNGASRSKTKPFKTWDRATQVSYVDGSAPRFASLAGPSSLSECGMTGGYGWYRVTFNCKSTKKHQVAVPRTRDRARLFLDGAPGPLIGRGPGADDAVPLELSLRKGERTVTVLAEHLGREDAGVRMHGARGIVQPIYEVSAKKSIKPKFVDAEPVDPFTVEALVEERARGQVGGATQAQWSFSHLKKSPILVRVGAIDVTGTFVLNDVPIAYHAEDSEGATFELLLDPSSLECMKRGKNELRFAPDLDDDDAASRLAKVTTFFECTNDLTQKGSWSFARWERPTATAWQPSDAAGDAESKSRLPCWYRGSITLSDADRGANLCLDLKGLSKGQLLVNGTDLGRYCVSIPGSRNKGRTEFSIPAAVISQHGRVTVEVFDEFGHDPSGVRLKLC